MPTEASCNLGVRIKIEYAFGLHVGLDKVTINRMHMHSIDGCLLV